MINWAIGRELLYKTPFFHRTLNPNGISLLKGENERSRRIYPPEEKKLLSAAMKMRTPVYRYAGAVMCTAPGSLDTHLCYAAWRSSYSSRASIGV